MRICLFEWNTGGHHDLYARAFAEALQPMADVVVAAPDSLLEGAGLPAIETYSLGEARPRPAGRKLNKATLAHRELDLLRDAIEATRADHAVVLFADPILRWLARAPRFPCQISVFAMFANAHFPRRYHLPLTPRERASALFKEWNIRSWRRRSDSHVLFGLDAEAVEGWNERHWARAIFLPEPPVEHPPSPQPPDRRRGCLLFGYFDERKGMERLADALGHGCEGMELTLLGDVAPEYRDRLEVTLARFEAGGVQLTTDFRRVPHAQAMEAMARSRCALLSFGWRPSGSRVLLEAAIVRTPVVVGNDSAVGRLVERHDLGLTADPTDPAALRAAILSLASDAAPGRFESGLRHYAEVLHGDRFARTVREAFGSA